MEHVGNAQNIKYSPKIRNNASIQHVKPNKDLRKKDVVRDANSRLFQKTKGHVLIHHVRQQVSNSNCIDDYTIIIYSDQQ